MRDLGDETSGPARRMKGVQDTAKHESRPTIVDRPQSEPEPVANGVAAATVQCRDFGDVIGSPGLGNLGTGVAPAHERDLYGDRRRAARLPNARFGPGVEIGRQVDREPPRLSEDRPAADDSEFCEPFGRTREAPTRPDIGRRVGSAKIALSNCRCVHSSSPGTPPKTPGFSEDEIAGHARPKKTPDIGLKRLFRADRAEVCRDVVPDRLGLQLRCHLVVRREPSRKPRGLFGDGREEFTRLNSSIELNFDEVH